MGNHPDLLPAGQALGPDPFVVFPIEAALETARDFGGQGAKWILIFRFGGFPGYEVSNTRRHR